MQGSLSLDLARFTGASCSHQDNPAAGTALGRLAESVVKESEFHSSLLLPGNCTGKHRFSASSVFWWVCLCKSLGFFSLAWNNWQECSLNPSMNGQKVRNPCGGIECTAVHTVQLRWQATACPGTTRRPLKRGRTTRHRGSTRNFQQSTKMGESVLHGGWCERGMCVRGQVPHSNGDDAPLNSIFCPYWSN